MASNGPDRMLPWLGVAAREARETAGRRLAHIAVAADVGEDAVRRFELGYQWPRSPDGMITAYAHVLDMEPIDIWREGLRRWEQER